MKHNYENLRPDYFNEQIEGYLHRVAQLLPNFPQDVIGQWLHDHFDSVLNRYSWLNFSSLDFKLEKWNKEHIFENVKAWNEMAVESWKKQFLSNPNFQMSRLGTYMIERRTWPVPPIVLNNTQRLKMPAGHDIAEWELVEGHHRLAYLKALDLSEDFNILDDHFLWIMRVSENATV